MSWCWHTFRLLVGALAVVLVLSLGGRAADPVPDKATPTDAAKSDVQLVQTDYAGFFKVLEKFKGKVILVDVWAEF